MEDPKPLKRNLGALLVAAIWGAVIPILALGLFKVAGELWGHGTGDDLGPKNVLLIAMLLAIPLQWLSDVTGISVAVLNPYVVYGLLGALVSVGITLLFRPQAKD